MRNGEQVREEMLSDVNNKFLLDEQNLNVKDDMRILVFTN